MDADTREKRILAQRKKSDSDVQSFEEYQKQNKPSELEQNLGDMILSGVDALSSGASKTKELLKGLWKNISTRRWEKEEGNK